MSVRAIIWATVGAAALLALVIAGASTQLSQPTTRIGPPLSPVTTTPTTPTTTRQTIPWGPGHEEPQPTPTTTSPHTPITCWPTAEGDCYQPEGPCVANQPCVIITPTTPYPWITPTTTWHCGADMKPWGCINPTPTDIANATQACADMRADHSEVGVEVATNRLLSVYGRDGVTGLFRYATVAICPDMAEPVAQEWNNRMQRRGMGESDWDSMWKPRTSWPPAAPTTLPQQTAPGVPMVPPGGTLPGDGS